MAHERIMRGIPPRRLKEFENLHIISKDAPTREDNLFGGLTAERFSDGSAILPNLLLAPEDADMVSKIKLRGLRFVTDKPWHVLSRSFTAVNSTPIDDGEYWLLNRNIEMNLEHEFFVRRNGKPFLQLHVIGDVTIKNNRVTGRLA